ncbi:hypothetical protein TWF730_007988 [Orbilia blumenaviensis]|uniref:Elongin-A n=1 Tax=Orbilia blumenaviensis TaxID=1796055 RepID=A0AAV9V9H0_9PEZI
MHFDGEGARIPTLFELAKRVCIRHTNHINDVGELPYSVIRPVLIRVEDPDRLKEIEKNSPQLVPETDELWQSFIRRHLGEDVLDRLLNPVDYEEASGGDPSITRAIDWSTVYFNLRKVKVEKENAQVEELKAAMKKCYDKKEKRQIGRTNIKREDVGKLRSLDRGRSFSGVMSGRISKDTLKVFKNEALNRVLIRPRR